MKLGWPIEIAGTGHAVPEHVVTNADFERHIDTTDEWIVQRTGIRERRYADRGESTLSLAADASREALRNSGLTPADVDLIVVGTITPEHPLPSTACELQAALGCRWIPAFDLVAACSGFVYSLTTAAQYVQLGLARTALVIGVDCMTRMTDMEDRGSCILFGDAAGAVVLRRTTRDAELIAGELGADGNGAQYIYVPAGGAKEPASLKTVNERLHLMRMRGREVYKFAVTQMHDLVARTLRDAGFGTGDLKLLVPHQSNQRIIESACDKLGLPAEKVMINIHKYGNTSAASAALALHEAATTGRMARGDLVMLVAFGAGLTWGSLLLRY